MLGGSIIGGLLGLLLGPVGAVVGAGLGFYGGVAADLRRLGLSEAFIRSVGSEIYPNQTVLLAELDEDATEPVDTVIAQAPRAGQTVQHGSTVRINVSQGPKPVAVPPVVGESYDDAAAELQQAGFAVAREDVTSNEPAGTVVGQDPTANSLVPRGATIALRVSRGPQTSAVPDVVGLDRSDAAATLRNAGFRVLVQEQETESSAEDDIVLAQDPLGGSQQPRGATILITIGRLVDAGPATTTPTTTPDDFP